MIKKYLKRVKKLVFKNNLGNFVDENVLYISKSLNTELWQIDIC